MRFYDGKSFRSLVDRPSSVDEVVRLPRTSSSLALLEFRQLGGRWSLRELVVPKTKALTRPSTKPRNAILWVVDTLRADRIRAYDPKTRVKTPNYDKVINEGTMLLGVKAVIAKSFERIHRSNLIGMGVIPLEFDKGQDAASLGLTGQERVEITGIAAGLSPKKRLTVRAGDKTFTVTARVDTPQEVEYMLHGGILQYVLRQRAAKR